LADSDRSVRTCLTPEAIKEAIAEIRSLTSKPFAMNLVGYRWKTKVLEHLMKMAFTGALRRLPPISPPWERLTQRLNRIRSARFEDQARVLLDAKVRYSASSLEFRQEKS